MNGTVSKLSDSPSSSAYIDSVATTTTAYTPGASTVSAVYAATTSKLYFFNSCSASYTTGGRTYVYWADGSTLKYLDSAISTAHERVSCSANITSIAATSDAILLGTNGRGLQKTTNASGVPGSSLSGFSTNADSALDAPYIIPALLCIDSAASETGAMLYASADFKRKSSSSGGNYKDIGLWSYYPSRGNWNRE